MVVVTCDKRAVAGMADMRQSQMLILRRGCGWKKKRVLLKPNQHLERAMKQAAHALLCALLADRSEAAESCFAAKPKT